MNHPVIQRHVYVLGRVQGVGFRWYVQTQAKKFPDLLGYVRNMDDGRVEAVFLGAQNEVLEMVALCRHGPSEAHVLSLCVVEETLDSSLGPFETFRI